jgi:hypothetical protein
MKVSHGVGLRKPKNMKLAITHYLTQYHFLLDHLQNDVQYAAVNFCTTGFVGGCSCTKT